MPTQFIRWCLLLTVCLSPFVANTSVGDEKLPARERLQNDQEAISGRYARFERLLSQMADMMGHEDPERAELLRRAISKGRERAISSELNVIATTLGNGEFGAARERQKEVTQSLQLLLKLLQSEDRRSSVEKDAERLENILKNVRNTITETKAARNLAQNSTAPSNAAPAQRKALDKTDDILNDIQKHDDAQAADSEPKDGDEKPGQNDGKGPQNPSDESQSKGPKSEENKNGKDPKGENPDADPSTDPSKDPQDDKSPKDAKDAKSGEQSGKPPKGDPQDSDSKPSEGSPPSDSPPSDKPSPKSPQGGQSKPGDSKPQNEQQPQDNTPGREELEAAQQLMQEALEELQQQKREEAIDDQDQAITQLQKAAKELEEMLKQLREEEKEMVLAALEARFQRLLALQTQIYETTVDLGTTPRSEWLNNAIGQCREIAQQQADVTRECSQTTGLLREDGTSVSILVAVEDIESDMGSVALRLQRTKTGKLTQAMETDIIEALNELIKATQKEMEEMKSEERKQQQQNSKKKPPLVELMAEIRVLRSLQLRVNRRTTQVHELLQESDSADTGDLTEQLEVLARRQNRLRESASELAERMEQQR